MLGCSLTEIWPEEALQSTTSQPLEGVLPLNVSLGLASGLGEAKPLDLCTVKLMMVRDRVAVRWQKYQCCLKHVIKGKNVSNARAQCPRTRMPKKGKPKALSA